MTPLLAQWIALLVVFISLIMLLLMGYLLWLQRRDGIGSPKRCSAPTVIRATRQRPPMNSLTR